MDNLPLNAGNNTVSITMSNVINQSTVMTLNLAQSPVTLTIDPVGDDSQLWQPAVTLQGTVSDSSYAVWVNGVAATVNGNNWSAANVPTTAGGVAIFDATAYPPGEAPAGNAGGNGVNPRSANALDSSFNGDKPARLCMTNYIEKDYGGSSATFGPDYSEGDWSWTFSWNMANSCKWKDNVGGNGSCHYDVHYNNKSGCGDFDNVTFDDTFADGASLWPNLAEGAGTYTQTDESEDDCNGIPYSQSTDSEPDSWYPCLPLEHCKVQFKVAGYNAPYIWYSSYYPLRQENQGQYQREADATMSLETGGRAEAHRQNLFCLSGSAAEVLDQRDGAIFDAQGNPCVGSIFDDFAGPTAPIPMQAVTIDGMPLGADGNQWRLYDDGTTHDVTPKVKNKDFYTFTVNQQKYKLHIDANGHNLDDEKPEFIVGQHVTFTLEGIPTGNIIDMVGGWSLPQTYVNEPYLVSSNSLRVCTSYRINSNLLKNTNQTACWYVTDPGGHVNVGLILTFNNGQSAIVTAKGDFTVIRPLPSFSVTCSGPVHASLDGTLGFGSDPSPPGISFQMTNVPLDENSHPYGSYYIKQLEPTEIIIHTDSNGTDHKTTWSGEDHGDAGGGALNGITGVYGNHTWTDAPHSPWHDGDTKLSVNESFEDYLMFTPGGDAIAVPMYCTAWGWGGTEQPIWTVVSSSTNCPNSPTLTTDFPKWTNIQTP